MIDNKSKILAEIESMKGQQVLYGEDVYRLDGFAEDEHDYYYVLTSLRQGTIWGTCVCGIYQLKDKIDEQGYESLVRVFELNKEFRGIK